MHYKDRGREYRSVLKVHHLGNKKSLSHLGDIVHDYSLTERLPTQEEISYIILGDTTAGNQKFLYLIDIF